MAESVKAPEREAARPQTGKPTPGEQGLASTSPRGRPESSKEASAERPRGRTPEELANYLIEYLGSGGRPSYKVVLQAILVAQRARGGLGILAQVMIERPAEDFGNYLNLVFIVLQADGSREIARQVAQMFSRQGVLVIPGEHRNGQWRPFGEGTASPDAPGLAAVLTYEGRTLVQLGGEAFYISGKAPPGTWKPKSGSTSVVFISRAANPKRMYRLDYDTLKEGPKAGQKGWEHNQKGVAKVLDLKVSNHQPVGGWGRVAGWTCRAYKWGGRASFAVGMTTDGLDIYFALDRGRAVARMTGRAAGVAALAPVGMRAGGAAGARGGPWSAVGGVALGGLMFGWFGALVGQAVADWGYCRLFTPLESEVWEVFWGAQVEPIREGVPSAVE